MRQGQKFEKGATIEKKVVTMLPKSVQTSQSEFYDIDFRSLKIEVKSAELRISQGRKKGTRWGRFVLEKKCHEALVLIAGWYALVLTFKQEPILIRFIAATNVKPYFSNSFGFIPFTDLYKGISLKEFLKVSEGF